MNGENEQREISVIRSDLPPFDEYCAEIRELWDSRWLTNMGVKHRALEQALREYLDAAQLLLFTNGHLALEAVLRAMDLKGEVITTPFTFSSTTHAIARCGLTPVFCDVREDDYTIDASKIEALITGKTCAILPVHVYGNLCAHDEIERIARAHGLKLVYDAAHAFGVRKEGTPVAQLGDASMYSFHATKVFHTIEGGAVTFQDPELADRVRWQRNFGIDAPDSVSAVGGNGKMNEFQAAMGLCNLRELETNLSARHRAARRYRAGLSGVRGIACHGAQPGIVSNDAYFPIFIDENEFGMNRDDLQEALARRGIGTRKYFYPPTNELSCYGGNGAAETPVAHRAVGRVLALPMHGSLTEADVDLICEAILREGERHGRCNP